MFVKEVFQGRETMGAWWLESEINGHNDGVGRDYNIKEMIENLDIEGMDGWI